MKSKLESPFGLQITILYTYFQLLVRIYHNINVFLLLKPQEIWQQHSTADQTTLFSPAFKIRRQLVSNTEEQENLFPSLRRTHLDFHSIASHCSSAFVSPTMENVFMFLQSGVAPFPN